MSQPDTAGDLRARLRHVYCIGGGSGAGKSVIARRLAPRHGLRRYATDDVMADHGRRSSPADTPYLSEFAAIAAPDSSTALSGLPSGGIDVPFIRLCRGLTWLIRATRWIGGTGVHRINLITRIYHAKPERSPPDRLSMRAVMSEKPKIRGLLDRGPRW